MSELTKCSYCTLLAMRREAEARGAEVLLAHTENGWVAAWFSDTVDPNDPVSMFMKLTDHCVCDS